MMTTCGCCGGARTCKNAHMHNRPGLAAIAYRAGTHASFLQAMKLRLSSTRHPELAALNRRDNGDASIALLDAWAVAADVLSFYSERIANENYLRTATERRSVLELARLTGYRLRPGVAASVFLAYELEATALPLTIPIGTRVQSVPGPGETMQTFETAEVLEARAEWNSLRPRMSQPLARTPESLKSDGLYLQGVATQLKPNDGLLIVFGGAAPQPFKVDTVTADSTAGRTRVTVRPWNGSAEPAKPPSLATAVFSGLMDKLTARPRVQPRNALRLARNADRAFTGGSDVYPQLLQRFNPILDKTLYAALANAPVTAPVPIKVYALRTKASLFAHNAVNQPVFASDPEPPHFAAVTSVREPNILDTWGRLVHDGVKNLPQIPLDRVHDQIKPGTESFILIDRPDVTVGEGPKIPARLGVHRVAGADTRTMAVKIGAALEVTLVTLDTSAGAGFDGAWLDDLDDGAVVTALLNTDLLRGTRVYAQSEELALAEEPLADPLCDSGGQAGEIELDALYDGLKTGRWLTISGERSDVGDVAQIAGSELVMLAAVRHGLKKVPWTTASTVDLPGDRIHTFITLAKPLAYCYKRESATLNANVVRATHGETRREAAGGGDPTQVFQQFPLKQPPLTYVAAPTPEGVASTLAMWISDVRWPEVPSLLALGPTGRGYISRRDNEERTTVIFGDGKHGALLPGGVDNVRAIYRSGIGKGGNVTPGQISLATDKPLGVKGVRNPLRASGGAGPDTLDQARENAPLAVMALDRLVSVRDYADFTRLFAGIGKAAAVLRQGPRGQYVQVTIAGVDDIPIDENSDLYQNLKAALLRYGDPHLPLKLVIRDALALVINAKVALKPDYAWETVAPKLRATLNAAFGFARSELGQDVLVSAIVAAIVRVEGVAYTVVQALALDQDSLVEGLTASESGGTKPKEAVEMPVLALAADPCAAMRIVVEPTQIAYLAPEVPDTLILELL